LNPGTPELGPFFPQRGKGKAGEEMKKGSSWEERRNLNGEIRRSLAFFEGRMSFGKK